jgi:hypothetical protein
MTWSSSYERRRAGGDLSTPFVEAKSRLGQVAWLASMASNCA